MKKCLVFFLSGFLFLGFCLSSSVVAGEGESPPGYGTVMPDLGGVFTSSAEAETTRQDEENTSAMESMASGLAGLAPLVPLTIQFHVPVSVSNLPPEITKTGVRCLVKLSRSSNTKSLFGPARNGGRTILLSVPVSVPFDDVMNNSIHGTYDCRILIQAGNETPVSLSDIRNTIELDGSQQILKVRGSF